MGLGRHPRISVLIVGAVPALDVRRCLDGLEAGAGSNLETIVLDEDSGDAVGRALAEATGDYVALVRGDAVVRPTYFDALVAFLDAHPDAAAASGKIYVSGAVGASGGEYFGYETIDPTTCRMEPEMGVPDDVREVASLPRGAVVFRRAAIEDIGAPFLEPRFATGYAEADFFARALGQGYRLYYVARAVAWRAPRADPASAPQRADARAERDRVLFAYRNLSAPTLASFSKRMRRDAVRELGRHPIGLLAGRGPAAGGRDLLLWILRNRPLLERHRAASANTDGRYERAVSGLASRASYYGHERPEVAAFVPERARHVIDVGCGAGALGGALKAARPGVEVRGIEPVADQAARARRLLDDVAVTTAEAPLPSDWPPPDCVVFADVLEHLVDPMAVLETFRRRLAKDGTIVVSIPNVTHRSVTLDLLRGRWEYVDAGVLDRTHLRFYTRRSAVDLVERAGFRVRRVERIIDLPADTRLRRAALRIAGAHRRLESDNGGAGRVGALDPRRFVADLCTVQFLILAEPR